MKEKFKEIYYGISEIGASLTSMVSILLFSSLKSARKVSKLKEDGLVDVHILANGPSLKSMLEEHLDFLSCHDTLAVNHFASNPTFSVIKPKYYVLLDPAYFGGYCPKELQDRIPVLMANLSKVSWPMTLYVPYTKTVVRDAESRLNNPNIKVVPFNGTRVLGFMWFRNWAYKYNLGIPSSKNVLLPSILLMLNHGYKKVYLYGAEFSWTKTYWVNPDDGKMYTDDVHFYDKTCIPLKKGEFKFNLRCLAEALDATDIYEEYALYLKSKIINRTPGSFIDSFEYEPTHLVKYE